MDIGQNIRARRFNTQPPEGGWEDRVISADRYLVSTHSRLKAAATAFLPLAVNVSFNTQPPEGGCHYVGLIIRSDTVSTHSRLKAAD